MLIVQQFNYHILTNYQQKYNEQLIERIILFKLLKYVTEN